MLSEKAAVPPSTGTATAALAAELALTHQKEAEQQEQEGLEEFRGRTKGHPGGHSLGEGQEEPQLRCAELWHLHSTRDRVGAAWLQGGVGTGHQESRQGPRAGRLGCTAGTTWDVTALRRVGASRVRQRHKRRQSGALWWSKERKETFVK